jgi:hypothetical protein
MRLTSFEYSHFPLYCPAMGCPVEGWCPYVAPLRNLLRRHFINRHSGDTLTIVEEGPLAPCELCGMQVTPYALQRQHRFSALCNATAQRRLQRQTISACRRAGEQRFSVYGVELGMVNCFTYLGRPLSATDSDWPALYKNLAKARTKWAMISRVLRREGANTRVSGMFYKAVVQSVLLFGSESWVWSQSMVQTVEGFHNRVARRLSGKMPVLIHGTWVYPPIAEALEAAALFPIERYIASRRGTVHTYVQRRPIYEICCQSKRLPGTPTRTAVWWEQCHIVDNLT